MDGILKPVWLSNKLNHKKERGTEEGLMHAEVITRDASETDAPLALSPSQVLSREHMLFTCGW